MKSAVWLRWMGVFFATGAYLCPPAQAGKLDQVKKVVREACRKEIPDEELMEAVLAAFDCTPGTDVKVAECKIRCQKQGDGKVVGK